MPCCVCRLETRGCSLQYALACDTVDKDLMFPEYLHVCTICVNVDPVPSPSLRYHCSPLVFAHCRALPENLCMDSWLAGDIRTSRACICRVLNMWAADYRQQLSYSTCIRVELIWNWIVTHSLIKTPGSEAGTLEAKPQSMLPSFTIWYIYIYKNMRVEERVHSRRKKIHFAKTFGRDERSRIKEFMFYSWFGLLTIRLESCILGCTKRIHGSKMKLHNISQTIAGSHPI